jgi:hypothetical protein
VVQQEGLLVEVVVTALEVDEGGIMGEARRDDGHRWVQKFSMWKAGWGRGRKFRSSTNWRSIEAI